MNDPASAAIENGLAAWARGDLDALEQVLDPQVTLKAVQPGPWDCESREQVMALLRRRENQRAPDEPREIRVTRRDDATFLVSGLGGRDGTATMVTVANGRVVALQQVTAEPRDTDADAAVAALRTGDLAALEHLLDARPSLVRERVPGFGGRTLLHVVTDWPGYTPNSRDCAERRWTPLTKSSGHAIHCDAGGTDSARSPNAEQLDARRRAWSGVYVRVASGVHVGAGDRHDLRRLRRVRRTWATRRLLHPTGMPKVATAAFACQSRIGHQAGATTLRP